MNKNYINGELIKRGVYVSFYWHDDMGPALFFDTKQEGDQRFWHALLPIDDESDAKFVDFVEFNYRKYYPK